MLRRCVHYPLIPSCYVQSLLNRFRLQKGLGQLLSPTPHPLCRPRSRSIVLLVAHSVTNRHDNHDLMARIYLYISLHLSGYHFGCLLYHSRDFMFLTTTNDALAFTMYNIYEMRYLNIAHSARCTCTPSSNMDGNYTH